MRLGLGSYACAWAIGVPGYPRPGSPLDAIGLVERAHRLGVHVVQICDNLPLDRLSPAELDRLERQASEWGMQITVGTRGISRPHLETYLGLALRFRSPILRLVVDTEEHKPGKEEIVQALRGLAPDLEAAGVQLAVENHDRFTAHVLAEVAAQVGSDAVGICLDTVNSFGALEGPKQVVSILAPWVVDLHIKDFCIFRPDHKMGFTLAGRPAGQGQLNIPWLLDMLQTHGCDPDAILELWPPLQETLAETIALEEEWCQTSIAYLRTLIAH